MSEKSYNPFNRVTLDEVVKDVCIELYKTTDTHHYQTFMRFAERGARDLSFDVAKGYMEVKLTLDNFRTAQIPADYVDYVAIGRRLEGQFIPYHYSPRILSLMAKDECGEDLPHDMISNLNTYYTFSRGSNQTGRVYGQGGGDNEAYFNIDEASGCIIFSAPGPLEQGSEVILRYKSDGISLTGNSTIHVYLAEALIEWIHWRRMKGNPKATRGLSLIHI